MDSDIPTGSVVVGMDGSESSLRALTWAAGLAAKERRVLTLLHAVEAPVVPYQGYGRITPDLARWRRELGEEAHRELGVAGESVLAAHPGLEVRRVVSEQDPRSALAQASERASVLVVGTHGQGRVARMVLGSVSEYVARHAECPVVVIRESIGDGPVVAGVGADASAGPVLELAFSQASLWGRALRVVHADPRSASPVATEDDRRAARLLMAETVAGYREKYPDVVASCEVLTSDDPESALVELSRSASLLVVGRRWRGMIRDLVIPPVVTAVLERATCPVAVVPVGTTLS